MSDVMWCFTHYRIPEDGIGLCGDEWREMGPCKFGWAKITEIHADMKREKKDRKMSDERTYDHPGDCIKCGHTETDMPEAQIRWVSPEMLIGVSGFLQAECGRCWYQWRVMAKDELEETDD